MLCLQTAVVEGDAGYESAPLGRKHLVEGVHVEVDALLGFSVGVQCRLEEVGAGIRGRNTRHLCADIRIQVYCRCLDVGSEFLYVS